MTISALFGSVGEGGATSHLAKCPGSPTGDNNLVETWHNCIGRFFNDSVEVYWVFGDYWVGEWHHGQFHGYGTWVKVTPWTDETKKLHPEFSKSGFPIKYVGEWENGIKNGYGTTTYASGKIKNGLWKNGKFVSVSKSSFLRTAFRKLSKEQRKQLQSNLKDLGLYKSSIDGLYGKGTSGALVAYNKQNLNGADLKNQKNVEKLISAVLALKPNTKTNPDSDSDSTYKVASGTGFYVSDAGHIITNHHVIEGCKDMKVHSNGNVLETKKIAQDRRNDLALLKIASAPKHSFSLSNESPFPLQDIVVAGFPFGEKVSSTLKFTEGVISSIAGLGDDYSQIQIDAALQPGNSGGPILDEYGNVVAVAVAKLSLEKILKDFGVVPENTNFGVKVSAVKNLMEGNGVPFKSPNTEVISKRKLSQIATDGTVYLTCWMTTAQIEQMRTRKVLFENLQ